MNYAVYFIYKRKRYATLMNGGVFKTEKEAMRHANTWNLIWKNNGTHIVVKSDLELGYIWKGIDDKVPKLNFKELSSAHVRQKTENLNNPKTRK